MSSGPPVTLRFQVVKKAARQDLDLDIGDLGGQIAWLPSSDHAQVRDSGPGLLWMEAGLKELCYVMEGSPQTSHVLTLDTLGIRSFGLQGSTILPKSDSSITPPCHGIVLQKVPSLSTMKVAAA